MAYNLFSLNQAAKEGYKIVLQDTGPSYLERDGMQIPFERVEGGWDLNVRVTTTKVGTKALQLREAALALSEAGLPADEQ